MCDYGLLKNCNLIHVGLPKYIFLSHCTSTPIVSLRSQWPYFLWQLLSHFGLWFRRGNTWEKDMLPFMTFMKHYLMFMGLFWGLIFHLKWEHILPHNLSRSVAKIYSKPIFGYSYILIVILIHLSWMCDP